jgi:hypothetical protein
MGTPLDTLYKRFQTKVDEDLTYKESLIFALVDVAISKSYKTCRHSLIYVLDEITPPATETYNGNFNENLDSDEIELLALWMSYEWNRRRKEYLKAQRDDIGTKDFNRLPDKVAKFKAISTDMKEIKAEIDELKNEFNTYKYS